MKIMAFIPARGGSKGVPGKNKKILGGKPLVAWTIEDALEANKVDRVVVSSDDDAILHISEKWGGEPITRPAELATDTASLDKAFFHTLRVMKEKGYEPDYVVAMFPTSPFRTSGLIDRAVNLALSDHEICYVHALRPIRFCLGDLVHPDGGAFMNSAMANRMAGRTFCLSMNFGVEKIKTTGSKRRGIELKPDECVDIDMPVDWQRAERIADRWI